MKNKFYETLAIFFYLLSIRLKKKEMYLLRKD